jgi:hypothetical protein
LEEYNTSLANSRSTSEYYTLNAYVCDIYAEIYLKIQSSNDKFLNLIYQIDKLIATNNELSKYKSIQFYKLKEIPHKAIKYYDLVETIEVNPLINKIQPNDLSLKKINNKFNRIWR